MSTAPAKRPAPRKRSAPAAPKISKALKAAAEEKATAEAVISVRDAVNLENDLPVVILAWGEQQGVLASNYARTLGLRLIQAAERADGKAALVRLLREDEEQTNEQITSLLGLLDEAIADLRAQPATQA